MFPSMSFSSVASGVLNMTTDFAPLFMGLVVLLGLSVLGIAFAIGVHDSREIEQQLHLEPEEKVLSLPKAA